MAAFENLSRGASATSSGGGGEAAIGGGDHERGAALEGLPAAVREAGLVGGDGRRAFKRAEQVVGGELEEAREGVVRVDREVPGHLGDCRSRRILLWRGSNPAAARFVA